ncbi:hypothetical protein HDU91_003165, partial [Kappamyces sp. JEL0680]
KADSTLLKLSKRVVIDTLKEYSNLQETIKAQAQVHYDAHLKRSLPISSAAASVATDESTVADLLKKMSIFANCDDQFLRNLANRVTIKQVAKNDIIFQRGDASHEIFFVVEGQVDIVADNQATVYDTIHVGDFFGEIGVIKQCPRNATTRASADSVLVILSGDEIKHSLQKFPDSYKAIVLACDERELKVESRKELFSSSVKLNLDNDVEKMAPLAIDAKEPQVLGVLYYPDDLPKKKPLQHGSSHSIELLSAQCRIAAAAGHVDNSSPRSMPITNITELTTHELSVVLQHATVFDLAKLRRTCRKWKQQLSESVFCAQADLQKHSVTISNRFLKSLSLFSGSSLEYINLTGCGKITDEGVGSIVLNCPNIKRFLMASCWKLSDQALQHIGKNLVRLEQLDISHCNKLNGSGFQGH